MPSSSSPSSTPSSSSSTLTRRRKLTTTLVFIFSFLSRLFKTLILSLFTSFMDDFFDFGSSSSSAAVDGGDDTDDFFLRRARRRRLAGSSPPSVLSLRQDRLFFVPLKWWKDSKVSECKSREGVLFTSDDAEAEAEVSTSNDIVLRLKKQCGGNGVYDDDDDDEKGGNNVEEDDQREVFSGREFALISESMWFKALKWHSDSFCSRSSKDKGVTLHAEDYIDREVFPLQVRLSVLRQTLSLLVKISPMDNSLRCYERASQIFDTECGPVHIWDFSGHMTQFFEGFGPMLPNGGLDHAVEEGELALAFGDLLRKLWVPDGMPVAPKLFKYTLENFAPQFSGYNQHDSQELLSFLLDGLHEDLNRVKHKPYIEAIDAAGRPDEMVADEYWRNHLARNNSIIVDMCHGQYRSTLVCPICKRVSVTFDPFMYLSLPLPSTTMRTMTVTVISTDGSSLPSSVTVTVPKCGSCEDLVHALGTSCSLRDDETLLLAEVYNNLILHFMEDPSDSLALIRDNDCLVAYRLPKERENCQLVVFIHERSDRTFGIPFVARVSNLVNGYHIRDEYMKLFRPFLNMDVDDYDDIENSDINPAKMEASMLSSDDSLSSDDEARADLHISSDFQFHFTDERGIIRGRRIKLSKPLNFTGGTEKLNVLVSWPENMVGQYDTSNLSPSPEVFRRKFSTFKMQESVSLYKCLEGFLKEEPLGPEDMWYCPSCKQHQQASKKLDLWRLPEILVVHLKRFSYSRFLKNKLETFVDFPIDKLDLAGFLAHKNSQHLDCYRLFAVSNHYGGLGGGHYTALVYHGSRWYEFNDSLVEPIREGDVKTSAAYVLFYRRISDTHADDT
ncbi:hypothetical protein KSS87_021657 [Heliosperma pusillum]|nr:hypothetical protein KSS87_021657 [Heliosperma pusillum]